MNDIQKVITELKELYKKYQRRKAKHFEIYGYSDPYTEKAIEALHEAILAFDYLEKEFAMFSHMFED